VFGVVRGSLHPADPLVSTHTWQNVLDEIIASPW